MPVIRRNESTAAKRRVAVYITEDDGVTPAPLATDFSAAGVIQVRLGGTAYVNAGGTFTNTGIDGEWVYQFTQAETNQAANELGLKIDKGVGFAIHIVTIPLIDPADVNDVNVVSIANDVITAASVAASAVTEIQAGLAVEASVEAAITALGTDISTGTIPVTVGTINNNVITAASIAADAVSKIWDEVLGTITSTTATARHAMRRMYAILLGDGDGLLAGLTPQIFYGEDGVTEVVNSTNAAGVRTNTINDP